MSEPFTADEKSQRDEISRIRLQYAQYRELGMMRGGSRWSWYDPMTALHRTSEWLTFLDLLREAHLVLEEKRVLDVGCGNGRWLRAILDLGAAPAGVLGLEILSWRVEEARRLAPHIRFQLTSGVQLEIPDESFDLVAQSIAFSSIADPALRITLAKEMQRVTSNNGYIYWYDLERTTEDALAVPLDVEALFPGWPVRTRRIGPYPTPGETIRPLRGLKALLVPFLNRLGYPATHRCCLLGPKPMNRTSE